MLDGVASVSGTRRSGPTGGATGSGLGAGDGRPLAGEEARAGTGEEVRTSGAEIRGGADVRAGDGDVRAELGGGGASNAGGGAGFFATSLGALAVPGDDSRAARVSASAHAPMEATPLAVGDAAGVADDALGDGLERSVLGGEPCKSVGARVRGGAGVAAARSAAARSAALASVTVGSSSTGARDSGLEARVAPIIGVDARRLGSRSCAT